MPVAEPGARAGRPDQKFSTSQVAANSNTAKAASTATAWATQRGIRFITSILTSGS
ncbi:hypothetical protein GCM10022232_48150 [Streptomyces plumbiresistens]|uniref:Uncharacterized protein n=1 Tax=Streptomyces plumbiresistens TaxID=511811 RepID=A0ABP7RWX4_9ACTN